MPKFRKKPVVIEAMQFTGKEMSLQEIPQWLVQALANTGEVGKVWPASSGKKLLIETLEGTMTAEPGDWIIQGVKGELYPCKPDIFAQTYEAVA